MKTAAGTTLTTIEDPAIIAMMALVGLMRRDTTEHCSRRSCGVLQACPKDFQSTTGARRHSSSNSILIGSKV